VVRGGGGGGGVGHVWRLKIIFIIIRAVQGRIEKDSTLFIFFIFA